MTMAPGLIRRTTGRGHMPCAVRKAEARPPAPGSVSKVAADPGARIRRDLGGQKRRGGSGRHGQLKAAGTVRASPALIVLCLRSRTHHERQNGWNEPVADKIPLAGS